MKLVVTGAGGRMGRELIRTVMAYPETELSGAIERPDSGFLGADAGVLAGAGEAGVAITGDPLPAISEADGILDFTSPDASPFTLSVRPGWAKITKRRSPPRPVTRPSSNRAI